jgi:hypothetical protein
MVTRGDRAFRSANRLRRNGSGKVAGNHGSPEHSPPPFSAFAFCSSKRVVSLDSGARVMSGAVS